MKLINKSTAIVIACLIFSSCEKGWIDAKPDKRLVVPSTLTDLQALLDNDQTFTSDHPVIGELSSDDYYLSDTVFQSASQKFRNLYGFEAENVFAASEVADWNSPYQKIMYANNVLEAVEKIDKNETNLEKWKSVKGSALFFRALSFYEIAQLWCKPFSVATAATDLGIILRLKADINEPSVRASIEKTYDQIVTDLNEAKELLADVPPAMKYKTRPSKAAALALLARVYLTMGKYEEALTSASDCLEIYSSLLDFNSTALVNPSLANPIALTSGNIEIIYHCKMVNANPLPYNNGKGKVDSSLFKSYDLNDLRRSAFFKNISGRIAFVGTYDAGPTFLFNGLATDEVYLTRAECYARKGNKEAAMQDLNTLMQKRWKTANWTPFTAADADDALVQILAERRKELCFRGIRWTDLRRLNLESNFAKTVNHGLQGVSTIFTLPPNDNRYVFPIPDNEILYSGVPQNPR